MSGRASGPLNSCNSPFGPRWNRRGTIEPNFRLDSFSFHVPMKFLTTVAWSAWATHTETAINRIESSAATMNRFGIMGRHLHLNGLRIEDRIIHPFGRI